MIESFVDLNYRGLSLGRRIKLTQVRPTTGYLEHPTPMPVGTHVAIATDEGVSFDAVVTHIHEQVGGTDRAPGMTVRPQLADDRAAAWWAARVALPEEAVAAPVTRPSSITVRPRTRTIPEPAREEPAPAVSRARTISAEHTTFGEIPKAPELVAADDDAAPDGLVDDGKKTTVMEAVDPELLAMLGARITAEMPAVVDDGKQTMLMESVDPSALGLETSSSSGSIPVVEGDGDEETSGAADSNGTSNGNGDKPRGSVKRRKKRR